MRNFQLLLLARGMDGKRLEIYESEAAIVGRIFEFYAAGHGLKAIPKKLIQNLVSALADATRSPAVMARISEREAECAAITDRILSSSPQLAAIAATWL